MPCVSQAVGAIVLNVKAFDEGHFAISSIYCPALISVYKQLAVKPVWHPQPKLWAFANEVYQELMEKLFKVDFAGQLV